MKDVVIVVNGEDMVDALWAAAGLTWLDHACHLIDDALAVMEPGHMLWFHRDGCDRLPCSCALTLVPYPTVTH